VQHGIPSTCTFMGVNVCVMCGTTHVHVCKCTVLVTVFRAQLLFKAGLYVPQRREGKPSRVRRFD